jgi:hypothetical protein
VWRDWGPRCELCDRRNLLFCSSLRLRLPLRHAEYTTACYRVLGVDATVALERSASPRYDLLHVILPPLGSGRHALATAAVSQSAQSVEDSPPRVGLEPKRPH